MVALYLVTSPLDSRALWLGLTVLLLIPNRWTRAAAISVLLAMVPWFVCIRCCDWMWCRWI